MEQPNHLIVSEERLQNASSSGNYLKLGSGEAVASFAVMIESLAWTAHPPQVTTTTA